MRLSLSQIRTPADLPIAATAALVAILAASFVFVPCARAGSREYPYIYKSPRTLAMGGASIAIGGRFDSVFQNPAGLSLMPEKNWEVNVLSLSVGYNDNAIDFIKDLDDALDTGDQNKDGDTGDDQLIAVNNVLKEYRGRNIHVDAANLSSVANNYGKYSFGIGGLASAKVDAIPHQGFGLDGLLEMDANIQTGVIVGVGAKPLDNLHAGIAVKFLNRETVAHSFTARELVENEDDIEGYIKDNTLEKGSAVGLDAGMIYSFFQNSLIRPSVGFSVMDIGDTDFGAAGEIPMTVNLGVAATGNLLVFESLTVGLDYVDVLNNYEEDDDWGKRLRFGGELVLAESSQFSAALRAGLYQGYKTYGAEIRFSALRVSYTSYAEEIGAYAGQDKDRRHMIALNLGW
jgi:hypothetical protein